MRPRRVAAACVAAVALAAGCATRASFEARGVGAVEDVVAGAGLTVCEQPTVDDALANGAIESAVYVVALDCESDDSATVVVDRFDDREARDAAAAAAVRARPRSDHVVWTWGDLTIAVLGPRDDGVVEALTGVLDEAGAQ